MVRREGSAAGAPRGRRAPAPEQEVTGKAVELQASVPLARALHELHALRRRRDRLIRRKRQLLGGRAGLVEQMPPEWKVAHDRRRWRHGLGNVEFRDETALIDQFALMERFLTPVGDVVAEEVQVDAAPNKDERWWSFVMRGEAIFVRRFIAPQERFVRRVLARQRKFIDRNNARIVRTRADHKVRGGLLAISLFLPLLLLKLLLKIEGLLFLNVVRGQKALTGKAVQLPLDVKTGFLATKEEMRTQESRRKFRLSFLNERLWTPERRNALVFVLAVTAAVLYLLSEFLFQLLLPQALGPKRAGDIVLMYSMATRLFLPTPFEPILIAGARTLGGAGAVIYASVGATLGCYILFLFGSGANQLMHAISKKRPRLGKALHWMEDKGRTSAYWILGLLLAIPLAPDSLAIIGTVIRLRLSYFLMTIFISTVVRSALVLILLSGF
jgi:uncharacterized membrane protein YdjX (TVP38/TMEM64 family)